MPSNKLFLQLAANSIKDTRAEQESIDKRSEAAGDDMLSSLSLHGRINNSEVTESFTKIRYLICNVKIVEVSLERKDILV